MRSDGETEQRRRAYGVYCIQRRRAEVVTEHLRYTYAVQLKRRRAYAVTELVLRSNVYTDPTDRDGVKMY
jgi:hypothetical protein